MTACRHGQRRGRVHVHFRIGDRWYCRLECAACRTALDVGRIQSASIGQRPGLGVEVIGR